MLVEKVDIQRIKALLESVPGQMEIDSINLKNGYSLNLTMHSKKMLDKVFKRMLLLCCKKHSNECILQGRSLEKVKAPRSPGVVPPGQLPKEKIIKELKERKEIRLWKQ